MSPFTNPVENGYAIASVILTAVMMESAVGRAHYVIRGKPKDGGNRLTVLQYLESLVDHDKIMAAIRKVFSLRKALVHNHLWVQEISADTFEPTNLPVFLTEWYGDKNYRKVVDTEAGRSLRLDLNMTPTSVDTGDVRKVLLAVADAGMALEMKVGVQLGFSSYDAPFRGKLRTFLDVAEMF